MYVSVFIANFGFGTYTYFIPVFAQKFGATFYDLGLIGSAVALSYACTPFFVGQLADRVNRSWLLSFALIFNVITTIILVFSRSVADIVLMRFLGGLAWGFYYPTSEVLVTDLAPPEKRVREMAWYSASVASGLLVGPVFGGFLIQEMGFSMMFVLSTIMIAIAFVQVMVYIVPVYVKSEPISLDFSGSARTIRRLVPWYLFIACWGIIWAVITTILPGYANSVGMNTTFIGYLFAAFALSRIGTYVTSERYSMMGERRALLIATVLMIVGIVLVGLYPSFIGFLVGVILVGGCSGIIFPITMGLISRHFPHEKLGAGVGSYETINGLGQAVGPFIVGFIASLTDISISFIFTAIFGILMVGFIITARTYSNNS